MKPGKLLPLLCFLFLFDFAFAQSKRFSTDFHVGVPVTMASIMNSTSGFGGVGVRYNITGSVSVQGLMEVGTLSGKQHVDQLMFPDQAGNYIGFNNKFFAYTGNLQLNLERILKLRQSLKRINPYLVLGTGFMQSNVLSQRVDGLSRTYNQNFYMSFTGVIIRYYVSPTIDITAGVNYYLSQSPFIDGIAIDRSNDSYILNHIGITYKIGAKTDKQLIEWENVIIEKRLPKVKVDKKSRETRQEMILPHQKGLEKSLVTPTDADDDLIVFYRNRINNLQINNRDLKEINKEVVIQNTELQNEVQRLKAKEDEMQKEIDALKLLVAQLKQQNQELIKKDSLNRIAVNPKQDSVNISAESKIEITQRKVPADLPANKKNQERILALPAQKKEADSLAIIKNEFENKPEPGITKHVKPVEEIKIMKMNGFKLTGFRKESAVIPTPALKNALNTPTEIAVKKVIAFSPPAFKQDTLITAKPAIKKSINPSEEIKVKEVNGLALITFKKDTQMTQVKPAQISLADHQIIPDLRQREKTDTGTHIMKTPVTIGRRTLNEVVKEIKPTRIVDTKSGPVTLTLNRQPKIESKPELKSTKTDVSRPAKIETLTSDRLPIIDEIVSPPARYNLILGVYKSKKYALLLRKKLIKQGFKNAIVIKDSKRSRMLRVSISSTNNRKEALQQMRRIRRTINPDCWIHIYNKK